MVVEIADTAGIVAKVEIVVMVGTAAKVVDTVGAAESAGAAIAVVGSRIWTAAACR